MIYAIIIGCEIAFWVLIAAGLAARYLLRRPRLGAALLLLTPVVDLVLLAAAAIDLRGGGRADFAHTLAAIYLGFSVAYGHRMVKWADVRFAHRFAGGPAPVRLSGSAYALKCWKDVPFTLLAVGIAAGLLWLLTAIAPDPAQVTALGDTYRILGIILGIDVIWAISYTIWPKKAPAEAVQRV
ncbi:MULTISPECIES: hypothetical protein [unclassified Leucobacter]|uniref:hypothetical protein n=1 Tax=unclassified Leucobacter TaxID=2621730 RepID=UPI0006219B3D|nr:hypothetical protein [Leucobacter sp. Ag1]KKI21425.1 membrane protein [Leucobacter sp. Ag1]